MKRFFSLAAMPFAIAAILAGCADASSAKPDAAPIALIDGAAGMQNWTAIGSANWHASGEAIQADAMSTPAGGYLVSKNTYANFKLHTEFWVSDDAKTGVFLRCGDVKKITSNTCYEIQVYDQRPDQTFGTGSMVNVASAASPQSTGGKWNSFDITAEGSHLIVVLNGVRTVDVNNSHLANGQLILQYRGGIVKFRQFQITPL
jgi:hypothetical protein